MSHQSPEPKSSHQNDKGDVHMVGVGEKPISARSARASATVRMKRPTLAAIRGQSSAKGDVLATARIAGIQAAKRTWELIPLCHPVSLTYVEVDIEADELADDTAIVRILTRVDAVDRTGVEMEALVAASTAALTIYDMLKSIDRWMVIEKVMLLEKSGGRSGHLTRTEP